MAKMGSRGLNLEQGEAITLHASAATAAIVSTNDTAVYIGGERSRYIFILAVTAAATDADDTLDVYVDWSIDNVTFYNGGRFTQVLGNGGAVSYYMVFDATTPGTSVIAVTSDAAAGAVRPQLFGAYVRSRYVCTEGAGGGAAGFTFSVKGYASTV